VGMNFLTIDGFQVGYFCWLQVLILEWLTGLTGLFIRTVYFIVHFGGRSPWPACDVREG